MISREIWMLAATAATLGLVHTVIGPDHYLPFIVIGRARSWTLRKTLGVAFLAGLGHIRICLEYHKSKIVKYQRR